MNYLSGQFPVGSRCTHWHSVSCPSLAYASTMGKGLYSAPIGKKRNRCVLLQMKPLYQTLWAPQSIQLYRNYGIKNEHKSYLQVPELGLSMLSLQTRRTNLNAAWEIGEGRHTASSCFFSPELLNDSLWVDTGLSVWPEKLGGWTVWNDKQKRQGLPVAGWMETHCKTAAPWAKA